MTRGVVWLVGMLGCVAVAGNGWANSVHEARELTDDELMGEASRNRALAAYVERNGLPDVAERHFLASRPPWDAHEVTLYYLDRRTEIAFARAWILGEPAVHVERYERGLTDEELAALATRARVRGAAGGTGPTARAEAAALRAEAAADRVEAAVASVEQAADRAEAVASKMERGFERALRK